MFDAHIGEFPNIYIFKEKNIEFPILAIFNNEYINKEISKNNICAHFNLQYSQTIKKIGEKKMFKFFNSLKNSYNIYKNKIDDMAIKIENINDNIRHVNKYIVNECIDIKNEITKNHFATIIEHKENINYYNFFDDLYRDYLWKMMIGNGIDSFYTQRIRNDIIENFLLEIKNKNNTDLYILSDIEYTGMIAKKIHLDELKNISDDSLIVLAYNFDFNAYEAINTLRILNKKYLSIFQVSPIARYFHTNKAAYDVLCNERDNNPVGHFCPLDLENIFQAIENTKNLEGDIIEIGTYQGSSARGILNYINHNSINKKCYFLDTFEGFNYNEAFNSEDTLWKGSHTETSIDKVNKYLSSYNNYQLIKSNIITDEIPDEIQYICLANIDVDIYDAVKHALEKIHTRIVKNGIIIVEDYGHTPALIGAQKATNEFLNKYQDMFTSIYMASGQLFLIKK